MPTNLANQVKARVFRFLEGVEGCLPRWLAMETPQEFRAMEQELGEMTRALGDEIAADVLGTRIGEPAFRARTWHAAKSSGEFRGGGPRRVEVCFAGGGRRSYLVPYLKPDLRAKPGRRRGSGRRGRGGSGIYPVLAALGVVDGVSPALCGEICRQVADSDSVRSGRQALARRGIDLGHKQTLRIVGKFGQRAVEERDQWIAEQVCRQGPAQDALLAGKRVFISTDGGRCRIRKAKTTGRRRTKTGHRGYEAPWQEPKLLLSCVLDEKGGLDRSFDPVYDGTMGDCDALFFMLAGYLSALGADQAAEVIVAADGAKWIWERARELAYNLGIPPEKVTEVLDWYHAVETLHAIASIPAGWNEKGRGQWMKRAKQRLAAGDIDGLEAHIRTLAIGRHSRDVLSHLAYFTDNAARMQYRTFKARHIPRGSGAMESAVRRVINLRLKSNAKFWLRENAQSMLLMRSYLKAGRFDDLVDWTQARTASWWCSQPPPLLRASAQPATVDWRECGEPLHRRAA